MWHLLAQATDGSDAAAAAIGGGFFMIQMLFSIGFYVIMAIALMTIANKTGTPNSWMAWIPIANLVLMVQIAELEMWWTLVVIVTCGLAGIYVWMKIAERRGKPSWAGLLIIVPCVGWIAPLWIAFSD